MYQDRIHKLEIKTSSILYVLYLAGLVIGVLFVSSSTAAAAVRQAVSAQTPDAHCIRSDGGAGSYTATCDSLPQSLTVTFAPTLTGSKLILLAHWNTVDVWGGTGEGSMGGCTDNLGQNWLNANGQSVIISPPPTGTVVGITSITCQTAFPNPPPGYASSSTGKWGVLILHFFEVTGAGPGDSVTSSGWVCSVTPAPNKVTILSDYTSMTANYSSNPSLGDSGILGPGNRGLLTLDWNPGTYSGDFVLTSIYAVLGSSTSSAPLQFPNATFCLTVTVPQSVPGTESGINLGTCKECEKVAGSPINLTNGNVFIKQQDYTLPGLGGGITLERTWNSLWAVTPHGNIPRVRMFGDSWTSNYEERLVFVDSQTIDYWHGDGSKYRFRLDLVGSLWWQYVITAPMERMTSLAFYPNPGKYTIFFNGSTKDFDTLGRLISIFDRNDNATTLTYDQDRLTRITDAASRQITFTYGDPLNPNQVTAVQDALGTVATYEYDGAGRVTTVRYPDGSYNRFNYDAAALILSVTDTEGKVLEAHTYDAYRRGLTSEGADGVERLTISYGGNGVASLIDSQSHTTGYTSTPIHERNVLTGISGPGCVSCGGRGNHTFVYDADGNRTSTTDALSNTTNFTYDAYGHVTSRSTTVNGTPLTWNFTYYGDFDEVSSVTDPLGNKTTNTFDANLLTTTTPSPGGRTAGSTTSFTYDTKGQLLTVTDPLNHVTTFTYSPAGLVETVTDAQSKITRFEYDARGNRTAIVDALNQRTSFAYDSRNRLTSIAYPTTPATSTSFTYDSRGRRTSVTDANGKTTTYSYDDADRLVSVADAQTPAGVTRYAYDSENNLISITDALGRVTRYENDMDGRVTRTTFPSNLIETYTYDAVGNLTGKSDRKNQTLSYNYDVLGRLTRKQYPDATGIDYVYDGANRLTRVTDPTGTYTFTYDPLGRLTETSTAYSFLPGKTFTLGYAFDAASNPISMADPQGGSTTYTYDTLDRLSTLKNPQRNQFAFTYDTLGRRTQLARPNSINTNYQYDSLSRLASLLHQFTTNKGATTTLDGAAYSYDSAGNRVSRADSRTNVVSNYGYDPVYELTSVTQGANTVESYSFDAAGNRLSSLGVASYTYNASNQLTSQPGVTYTYDANGNLASKTDATGTTTYSWDFENRLTRVAPPGGAQVNFKYDPMGRRIQKSSSSGTVNYVYDGANILEEVDTAGNLVTRYTQGSGVDEPLAMLKSGTTSYYEADGLGSVSSLSNSSGALASTYVYDSFGRLLASSGTITNPYRFTGRELDSETGVYYYRARYYDPSLGRFISEDPIQFDGGTNFYAYAGNDPLNLIDPTGLAPACGCSEVPKMPPTINLMDNIRKAERSKWLIWAPPRLYWFYKQVQNHGPWDYKQLTSHNSGGINYQDLGNFNYGMTGAAAGIELQLLQRGAGWAQGQAGTSSPEWGDWYGAAPYGDDPNDQAQIIAGFNYYKKGCYK